MKGWRISIGALALVAALATARPVQAGYLEDAGWGSLTVLTNAVYMPAKLGGLTGGIAFALTGGDLQTAETVWVTSMGGTYVITPAMLQGQEPIAFTGTPSGSSNTADTHSVEEHPLGGS